MKSKFYHFVGVLALTLLLVGGVSAVRVDAGEGVQSGNFYDAGSETNESVIHYVVQEGDTLSEIAENFGMSLAQLVTSNNLTSNLIRPGDELLISGRARPEVLSRGNISREDLVLLARLIYAEARGESFDGQIAVGAVILNRIASGEFPDSIREVIMQRNGKVCQFSPVADGSINLEPDERAINAALQALMGSDPTGGALFFYNPHTATDQWIRTLPVITRIGNHVFATKT